MFNNIEQFQTDYEKTIMIDTTNIYLNKTMKYLLNFILIYFMLLYILSNNNNLTIIQLILIFCTVSSVIFYILDLYFPTCNFY